MNTFHSLRRVLSSKNTNQVCASSFADEDDTIEEDYFVYDDDLAFMGEAPLPKFLK